MQKIMFNERYGLQSAVFKRRKTQTRREPFYCDKKNDLFVSPFDGHLYAYEHCSGEYVHISRYAVGEIVAIAERYNDSMQDGSISSFDKGWKNKMFVKAELMPHHIKITNIRCERLQDISARDCISEGIEFDSFSNKFFFEDKKVKRGSPYVFDNAKYAFEVLIDRLNGQGFWDTNPYVIVYEFELV